MDDSEGMSADDVSSQDSLIVKKPKKRSLVERELETSLTARITSPISIGDAASTSRYGRARRLKTDTDMVEDKATKVKPLTLDTPIKLQSPVYRMHASNSPMKQDSPKSTLKSVDNTLDSQIENIYHENISLSRFSSDEKRTSSPSSKTPKVYVRKDLIQNREEEETIVLINNIFSPVKSSQKKNSHINNILERSSEKYGLSSGNIKTQNGYASVVKTLDFDSKKRKKENLEKPPSKSEIFDMEAKCEYQVGDLAWARMGTYPFWPCIVTRELHSGLFVKKKLCGRLMHDLIHVTFFGDNGRRSWILDNMLRKFLGQLEFEATREHFTRADKKKDPRLYSAFFISEKKIPQWNISVEEAETLLREPKRLRIDILYDMLHKSRAAKPNKQNKSGKITRTASDVSLSESLYDTLFSEDDGKAEDTERLRNKTRNKSLDVSDVVTACLDNMAAKTGITKIQKQSHMDRWLQKAKSKTPEKSQAKQIQKVEKEIKKTSKKKKYTPPTVISPKPYSLRRSTNESQKLMSHYFDNDNSTFNNLNSTSNESASESIESDLGTISKVESTDDSMTDGVAIKPENEKNEDTQTKETSESIDSDLGTISKVESLSTDDSMTDGDVISNKPETVKEDNTQTKENDEKINTECQSMELLDLETSDKETAVDKQIHKENHIDKMNGDSICHDESNISNIENSMLSSDESNIALHLSDDMIKDESQAVDQDNGNLEKTEAINDKLQENEENISREMNKSFQEPSFHKDDLLNLSTNDTNDNCQESTLEKTEINEIAGTSDVIDTVIEKPSEGEQIILSEILPQEGNESATFTDNELSVNVDNKSVTEVELNDNNEMSVDMDTSVNITERNESISNIPNDSDSNSKVTEAVPSDNVLNDNVSNKNVTESTEVVLSNILNDNSNKKDTTEDKGGLLSNIPNDSDSMTEDKDASNNILSDNDLKRMEVIEDFELAIDKKVTKVQLNNTEITIDGDMNRNAKQNSISDFKVINENGLPKNIFAEDVLGTAAMDTAEMDTEDDESDQSISNFTKNNMSPINVLHDEDVTDVYSKFTATDSVPAKDSCVEKILEDVSSKVTTTEDVAKSDSLEQTKITELDNSKSKNDKSTELKNCDIEGPVLKDTESLNFKDTITAIDPLPRHLVVDTEKTKEINQVQYVSFKKIEHSEEDDLFAHLPEIGIMLSEPLKPEIKMNENESIINIEAPKLIENISKVDIQLNYNENVTINNIEASKPIENTSKSNVDNVTNGELPVNDTVTKIDENLSASNEVGKLIDVSKTDLVLAEDLNGAPNIVETVKVNGCVYDEGDTSSINSEDVQPLSVIKKKLSTHIQSKLDDPDFVKYLEMRQDDLMSEHPELNENEIIEYLYKTWMYEENSKSDMRKTEEIQESNLVKGLESTKESKKRTRDRKQERKDKKKRNTDSDLDNISVKSGDISMKRWLRPKKCALYNENFFDDSRGTTPDKIKEEFDAETASLCSISSEISIKTQNSVESVKTQDISQETETKEADIVSKTSRSSSPSEIKVNGYIDKIKDEFDPETASINSEGSEISITKRRQKKAEKSQSDPEFITYLELRQDSLIDENPQLTREEIVGYLFKTWLYEESVKSDIKKNDDLEQSNLVKGLNQNEQKKKIKKKNKVDKDLKDFIVDDDVVIKDKPKRKAAQAYYNEEFSDIEDELEMFEISKGKTPKVELIKLTDSEVGIVDEVDEVEVYFENLAKPKPNLFKKLIREKVCEICETTGSLVKCKGCNSMFHVDCVKKETEVVENNISLPTRGRKKKKKKPGRKPKSLEDSGSQSDEKSLDVSAEQMSIDDIPESHTVDAENFESQLEAKMKELLQCNETEIHYDSYSSDDGLDWRDAVAGKCEIVDIKLKPKSLNIDITDFKCNNCQNANIPICFVCKKFVSKTGVEHRQRCQVAHCHKYYHLECLDHWPQTQFTSGDRNKKTNEVFENLMCPKHVCHTCVSDDPRGCKTRFSGDKLARCVRCPATYHSFTKCIPAGTKILTGSHIICPRHYEHRPGKVPCHVNTGWCFICALGGTLICCEYCPTSFHAECLNIKPPEGGYMCEDCETGRLPLYGEMVWVKLGHYRWWPGIILHPSEIPENLFAVKHSLGEFVVRFFGQYDHYWVNRGRVFPFQEGDSGRISSQKSKIDVDFTTAMEHAQRAYEILKTAQPNEEESIDIASSLLPPHYVKLKVNKPCGSLCGRRVDIEESSLTQCECNPDEEDPCGPYSQCLNRMLLTECGPICRAGERCNNRAFEKRLYPKMAAYRTPHRGWGLKALEDVKAGQFVIEYVGELIDEEEFKRRMNRKHEIRDENFYFLTLDKERMIDAGPKGNLARFMNHCCEPNCETQKWTVLGDVRVGLFAIKDIPANSEVTFNYNLECAGIDKKRCLCGAKRCSGYIGAKPKQDESQQKKPKVAAKRTYKKRKNTEESPSTKTKTKRPLGRPAKPRELTEIEKDLLIIKNATNGLSSDSECSRLSSLEGDRKGLKRKRVSFDDDVCNGKNSPNEKRLRMDDKPSDVDV